MSITQPAPHVRRWMDVLSSDDGRTHQVAERVFTADPVPAGGRLVARCGRLLVVASLAAPPGPPCVLCAAAP